MAVVEGEEVTASEVRKGMIVVEGRK